jgi:copper chaperone CopZ
MARVLLGIKDVKRQADVDIVKRVLLTMHGVQSVQAGLDGQAAVEYDGDELTIMELLRALRREGYIAGMV